MALAPLFPEEIQFQAKNGRNLTAGWLNVYLAGTDDVAETFCDYGVTRNPQDIVLDDNGRAVVICESGVAYRLEVFDSEGTLLWTEEPIYCEGTGSGGSGDVEVESTDGSIYVSKTVAAGKTTFDLSTNTGDVPEMAEWGRFRAPAVSTPGALQLARVDGNLDVDTGVQLVAGNHYHVTTEIVITPDGTGINYRTVTFELQDLDGNVLASRTDSVDTSTSEPVTPELSVDLYPTVDVEVVPVVSWDDDIASVEVPRMDVHRFYAGFRAVPNTVATKTWVSANFLPNSASGDFVPWSGLEGTGGTITAISGSGIGTNYTTVSSIASSYAYSAASSKVDQSAFDDCCSAMSGYISSITSDTADISAAVSAITGQTGNYIPWSASGEFQPSGNYVSASDLSAYVEKSSISAESAVWNEASGISGKLDNSASSLWYPLTGNPSGFLTSHQELTSVIPWSALSGESGQITGISGSGLKGHEYSGINPVVVDNTADTIAVRYSGLQVDSSMTAYPSGSSIVLGVKDGVFATTAYVESAISGMSGDYVPNSAQNVAIGSANTASSFISFAQGVKNSARSDAFAQGSANSAVNESFAQGGKNEAYADSFAQGHTNFASGNSFAQGNDNFASANSFAQGRSIIATDNAVVFGQYNLKGYGSTSTGDSAAFAIGDGTSKHDRHDLMLVTKDGEITMYSSTADTAGTGIMSSIRALSANTSGAVDSAYVESAVSGKLDTTAFNSGDFYSTSNPSGFITGVDLSDYATTAYVDSSVSGKLDSTASSMFQPSGDYLTTADSAQFITSLPADLVYSADLTDYATTSYVDSAVSGVEITFDSSITTASGTSGITAGVNTSILSPYQPVSAMTAYQPSGDYYSATNPSGFITGVDLSDYATTAYVDSAVSGVEITFDSSITTASGTSGITAGVNTSILSPYQPVSAMTAYQPAGDYQPSGDYAYNSSLSGYIPTSESSQFITSLAGYATEGYVDSSVSGKLDATASSQFYLTSNPAGYITGVDLSPYQLTADMSGYIPTGESANYQQASAMTAYQPSGDYAYNSSLSGYIPTSESSKYVTSLAGYATESYVDSAVSGKQDASAMTAYQLSGDFYSASNPSGFITGVDLSDYATTSYVDSAVSGVEITFDSSITTASGTSGITASVNTAILSPYQLTADMSGFIPTSESANYQPASAMTAYQPSGDYYSASNPSGFITGVDLTDYATTAYVDSAVSGVEITFDSSITTASGTSGITAGVNTAILSGYQLTADMTAYQPSGDYIYASALGTGVI